MNVKLLKRFLCLTLCAVMLLGSFPGQVLATNSDSGNASTFSNDTGLCGANLRWTETGSARFATLTISGTGPMYDFEWHDPADYAGIGGFAPGWTYNLQTIIIENGATSIGSYAFAHQGYLESITIPASVTSIGRAAFDSCYRLADIYYGGSEADWANISIGHSNISFSNVNIHYNCDVPGDPGDDIPNRCGDNAFWEFDESTGLLRIFGSGDMQDYRNTADIPWKDLSANRIRGVRVEEGITGVGENAFNACNQLTEVYIADSVQRIGNYAFKGCRKLTGISIPDSVTSLGYYAFCDCYLLSSVRLPSGLTIIPSGLFRSCGLTNIEIPEGVTHIGELAFDNCDLVTATIPKSVCSIGQSAFYANPLTDVYYGGTEEEWAEIDIHYSNYNLENAVIHFVSSPPEGETFRGIRFFADWEESEQKVYFGVDCDVSCAVTGETDTTGLEELPIHCYVYVETKMADGEEILLSIRKVTSGMGTVESVGESQIVIGGQSYALSGDTEIPDDCRSRKVLFHYEDNSILGLEILQEKTGYLTYWYSAGSTMNIRSEENADDGAVYWLSDLTDAVSWEFLDWSIDTESDADNHRTDVSVTYLTDSNRQIYEILPFVEYRPGGFSEDEHGWPVRNHWDPFDYPKDYALEHWIYYVHGISLTQIAREKWNAISDAKWRGNCFGLSLLAVAQYMNKVDLKPYFSNEGSGLNSFGYESVVQKDGKDFCALYSAVNGNNVKNAAIIQKIEIALLSQFSSEVRSNKRDIDRDELQDLVDFLSSDDAKPLLISIGYPSKSHTVVAETDQKPIYLGNGRYAVPVYDCNSPEAPVDMENPSGYYGYQQTILIIDVDDEWYGLLDHSGFVKKQWSFGGPEDKNVRLEVLNVEDLGDSFFEDHYSFDSDELMIYLDLCNILNGGRSFELIHIDASTGEETRILEYVDSTMNVLSNIAELGMYLEGDEENPESARCIITLPPGEYIIRLEGKASLMCLYDNNVTVLGADKGFETTLNCDLDYVNIRGTEDGTEIACLQASSDTDVASAVFGVVNPGDVVTVVADVESRDISVGTTGDTAGLEIIHLVYGEETEITPDMVHQHIPSEPVRVNEREEGSYDLAVLCEVCGLELSREHIEGGSSAHIPGDITGDGVVNNKDLTRLFRYLSGYDVEVNEAALDVTGDGAVNNKDVTRLFRYLSGYDVEIH